MKNFLRGMVATALLLPMFTLAGTFLAAEELLVADGTPVSDNLYLAGGTVSVNDVIAGDLLAAGGQILVTSDVLEDVTLAGGDLTILGSTGGDVRAAGGNLLVAGAVGGDLVAAGGSVTLAPDVTVGRDLALVGGQLSIGGDIAGDAELTGGVVTLHGRILGDVVVRVDESFTIGDNAVIEGNIEYQAAHEDVLTINEGAVVTGEVVFTQKSGFDKAEFESAAKAVTGSLLVFKLITTLVTALVLVWLFKRFTTTVAKQATERPLKSLGVGFVTLVVVPIAVILLLVSLLGIPLGIMVGVGYIFTLLLSGALCGVVLGAWLSQLTSQSAVTVVTWKNASLGVILLAFAQLVPVVGWIFGFTIFLMTLGSITLALYYKVWLVR